MGLRSSQHLECTSASYGSWCTNFIHLQIYLIPTVISYTICTELFFDTLSLSTFPVTMLISWLLLVSPCQRPPCTLLEGTTLFLCFFPKTNNPPSICFICLGISHRSIKVQESKLDIDLSFFGKSTNFGEF